jgi:DNA topoisomerase-1
MTLVIVESPTKAKTLSKYLGGDFDVLATYGHVIDLPQKKIGVKIEREKNKEEGYRFFPEYEMVDKQKQRLEEIKKLSHEAQQIYLATDPDREGEAIAWHVMQSIEDGGRESISRIVFHEITKKAIDEAIKNPRKVDMQLVDAQQARRVLDRLVGYKLSPVLWRKVRRGLSAGRVQSVALRLVVEREREIEAFKPVEYWNIGVTLKNIRDAMFDVQLKTKDEKKLDIGNKDQADQVEADLRAADYSVEKVEKKELQKTPPPPFTTSTLQQAAANRMGWSAKKTMQVAQALYEGGYISYHRTDSTNIAVEAAKDAAVLIESAYGKRYALTNPRHYQTKSKVAQEAHEAIRPTDVNIQGSILNSQLNKDQLKLYDMIWKRFVACQMAEAEGVTVTVTVTGKADGKKYGLSVKGETITFDGWLKLSQNTKINDQNENGNGEIENVSLPELTEGEKLDFADIKVEQKFTLPPSRYNDASLIKALEERGIGRPSTYAPTLSTIQDRQYVERVDKRFHPTALGLAVNDFLVGNFPTVVDYNFTAGMEDDLDEIANGVKMWQRVISDFYIPFEKTLLTAAETASRVKVEAEVTGEKCPKCQEGEVVVRTGRFGKFLACSRYPECDYKANYVEKVNISCPKCQDGQVIVKRTKSRKTFYGCSNWPNCDFASWTKPAEKKPAEAN